MVRNGTLECCEAKALVKSLARKDEQDGDAICGSWAGRYYR